MGLVRHRPHIMYVLGAPLDTPNPLLPFFSIINQMSFPNRLSVTIKTKSHTTHAHTLLPMNRGNSSKILEKFTLV